MSFLEGLGRVGGTAISGIGRGVSVAPVISAGPSIGSISALSELGSVMGKADLGPINNGGAFLPSLSLKDTMPHTPNIFGPVVDISLNHLGNYEVKPYIKPEIFVPRPSLLNATDAVLEAQSVLSQANHWLGLDKPQISGEVREEVRELDFSPNKTETYRIGAVRETIKVLSTQVLPAFPRVEPVPIRLTVAKTKNVLRSQVANKPATESKVSTRIATVTETASQEKEVEEIVDEQRVVEEPKTNQEEEVIGEEGFYLVDEQVSQQRKHEIKEGVKKAKLETERLGLKSIPGWLVAKFLPGEHEGNRSQVLKKKGPDGSYQETVEAISTTGEFVSEQQAEKKFVKIIDEKSPIRKGKHGSPVSNDTVAMVFKYYIIKPVAYEVVQKRIIKKVIQATGQNQAPVIVVETPEIKSEPNLEDQPQLAEVFFKKAA